MSADNSQVVLVKYGKRETETVILSADNMNMYLTDEGGFSRVLQRLLSELRLLRFVRSVRVLQELDSAVRAKSEVRATLGIVTTTEGLLVLLGCLSVQLSEYSAATRVVDRL